MESNNVIVIDFGYGLRLALEACNGCVLQFARSHHLDGHQPVEARLPRPEYHRVPTLTEHVDELITGSQPRTDQIRPFEHLLVRLPERCQCRRRWRSRPPSSYVGSNSSGQLL